MCAKERVRDSVNIASVAVKLEVVEEGEGFVGVYGGLRFQRGRWQGMEESGEETELTKETKETTGVNGVTGNLTDVYAEVPKGGQRRC